MVRNLLSILAARQNSILSGASIIMLMMFASKFLGLVKDRMMVHFFNPSQVSIFVVANNLPDLLFQVFVLGTLSVAFIPVFIDHLHKHGEDDAFQFASSILNLSILIFGVLAILGFIFVDPINHLMAPGFNGPERETVNGLTRIFLCTQMFLIIGSFFIGISQSYQRFIVPSLAPFFYNLGIILGISLFSRYGIVTSSAIGVFMGVVMHVVVQIPLIRSLKFKYNFSFDFFNQGVREVFKLMSFRNLGLIFEQVMDKIGIALSTTISLAAPTQLTFAQHLEAAPIALFGATIGQAALPFLAKEYARGEGESFKVTLLTTLHQILFLTLPCAAILIVLRIPVVRLLFGAEHFSWDDTVLTGKTVAFLSLGLVAQSAIMLLVRGFYAFKDTKTTAIVSVVSVAVNLFFSVLFVSVLHWQVWSLGLSYAIASNISLCLLLFFLNRKVDGFDFDQFIEPALKMLVAASTAAVALYIPIKALDQLVFDTTRTVNLLLLTGIASLFGLGVYLLLIWLMDVKELHTFIDLIKKLGNLQTQVKSTEMVTETPPTI